MDNQRTDIKNREDEATMLVAAIKSRSLLSPEI
jgi:hypothetical protein